MTVNAIFKEMLKDSILMDEYNLTKEQLENFTLHESSNHPIIEVIKLLIVGNENNTPTHTINIQVKNYFETI